MKASLCYLVVLVSVLATGNVNAEPGSYLSVAAGQVRILDEGIEDPEAVKLEYRFSTRWPWQLAPGIGVAGSANEASFAFAWVERDFALTERWIVAPSFGLGFFDDGVDVKLGSELEFRSGVKSFYQFQNRVRLGVELFHLSNGGIADRNPGTEVAFISLSFPL